MPPPSDELIQRLEAARRMAASPQAPSWAHRVARPVRRILARLLAPQEAFNAAVTDYFTTIVRPLERQQAELRDGVGALHHAIRALSRQVDSLQGSVAAAGLPADMPAAPAASPPAAPPAPAHALSHSYVGFEDRFRGATDVIRGAQEEYLPVFAEASDVLDIGCGRGEFLSLLRERGIAARGIDLNEAMVAVCREQGLQAEVADAIAWLRAQPDASIGGLFAAQVVEHLEPVHLITLLGEAFRTLRPGAPIVLETINPACWAAFFESYVRDITHVRPLHPDTLQFLLVAHGFQQVDVRYRSPYPEHAKLQPIPSVPSAGAAVEAMNANMATLNRLLFGDMDYAVIGRRP